MIAKDSLEFKLWRDAFNIKAELTPAPPYSESQTYWAKVMERTRAGNDAYRNTHLQALAEHIFLGIILQLENESKSSEQAPWER